MTAAGTIVGRYELLRQLAAGGMGEIYLARLQTSVDGFGALVAVKVLPKNLSANQAFVKMFLDEARAVGRLHHKNIVQVRDISEHDGQYFMVMEYIAGQNLRELLGDASIPDRPLFDARLGAEIFADIASALGAAHGEGIVHRDVSPNNVMISDEGAPKLIDFGVARALGSASLTSPGTLKGKFGYMAPEYVRAEAYDHRVDIFSLGVVMWETFARRRLFRGTSAAEQLHQLLAAEIPRLDVLLPEFPADLATIVAEALLRDPAHRTASAAALVDSLTEVARGLPVAQDLTLRKWLERRIPGRLDDRQRTDQTLLSLPPGSAIPDFGVAFPDAGSTPGTYGFDGSQAARLSAILTRPDTEAATKVHTSAPDAPPTAEPPKRSQRPIVFGLFGFAIAAGVILAVSRGGSDHGAPPPTLGSETDPIASAEGSTYNALSDAHRQIGLKAMADGDYAKASAEFDEALKNGGGADLQQLQEMAAQLEHDDAARKAPPEPRPPAPTTVVQHTEAPPEPKKVAIVAVPRNPLKLSTKSASRETRHEPAKVAAREPMMEQPAPAPPAPTYLAVFSVVPKATVLVDGAVVGVTPLRVLVSPGDHRLVVKSGEQVLHSASVSASAGDTTRINVETPLAPAPPPQPAPPVAVKRPAAPPPPPLAPPTPRVTTDGDLAAGAREVAATCNGCHAKKGTASVSGRLYSRAQWERFFASGQHDRYQRLGDEMSSAQMTAARAYLRANAADTAENQGAGIKD